MKYILIEKERGLIFFFYFGFTDNKQYYYWMNFLGSRSGPIRFDQFSSP